MKEKLYRTYTWSRPIWSNWSFGARWQWSEFMKYVIFDLGPYAFCIEFIEELEDESVDS